MTGKISGTDLTGRQCDAFWRRVQRGERSVCWPWLGMLSHGYGLFKVGLSKVQAHRIAYELQHDSTIPGGLVIDHLCRNTKCCNPAHLEIVTQGENVRRGIAPTAANARKTHCRRGHEFTPANTIRKSGGKRECRECKRAGQREAWRLGKRKRGANGESSTRVS